VVLKGRKNHLRETNFYIKLANNNEEVACGMGGTAQETQEGKGKLDTYL